MMRHGTVNFFPPAGVPLGSLYVGSLSAKPSRDRFSVHAVGSTGSFGLHGGSKNKRAPQSSFGQKFGCVRSRWKNDIGFCINSKETMHLLNDRLAFYLEQVASLEDVNEDLERKIKSWYDKHTPQKIPDYSSYFSTIDELQTKISEGTVKNSSLILLIENARLAGEDLRIKYNMEYIQCSSVDADISNLRRRLDVFTLEKCNLECHVESLMKEMFNMKKDHDEDVSRLRAQRGARINVDVEANPEVNLKVVLTEIRSEYDKLMDRNIKEAENWFIIQSEEVKSQGLYRTEHLESLKSETIELRHTWQTLQIDLETLLKKQSTLEDTLAETETSYCFQLSQLQSLIDSGEAELCQLRQDLAHQHHKNRILMDVKTRLEMEIVTYRRLLEGEDIHTPSSHYSDSKGSHDGWKIVSITEEFENGRIVSTRAQTHRIKS